MSKNIAKVLREKTKNDLLNQLDLHGKCALIRCTGFGKTWTLAEITQMYKTVLYLYPAEVIKETAIAVAGSVAENNPTEIKSISSYDEFDFKNIKFMTYAKLARMTEEDVRELPVFSLIIMDECHRLGGERTKISAKILMDTQKYSHVIGATATPERTDAYDVIEDFFQNITVYPYTLHDAFQDRLLQRPVYCYCTYDIETDYKEGALTAGEDIDDMVVTEVLKSKLFEISRIYNIPNIMKDVASQYVKDDSYMKYIVFYANFDHLNKNIETVEEWFRTAFPEHKVNRMIVTTETKEYAENVRALGTLTHKANNIDLIHAVDMLNMGYHVDDLTGIVLYRGTSSSTIYIQQLGRVLSSGSTESKIVFDIVDNLHRKSFGYLSEEDKRRLDTKNHLLIALRSVLDVSKMSEEEICEVVDVIQRKDDKAIQRIIEKYSAEKDTCSSRLNLSDVSEEKLEKAKELLQAVMDGTCDWWKNANTITAEDLIATGHEATYRELIAKLVAEPVARRAMRAYEEHRKRWEQMQDIPYPETAAEMEDMLDIVPPLPAYARWQNVTTRQVLDQIYDKKEATISDIESRLRKIAS